MVTGVAGLQLVLLAVVGAVCAGIGLLFGPDEHGWATPAAIGIGAGTLAAAIARTLGLPSVLPVGVGALVCPAVWAVIGAALTVGGLRMAWRVLGSERRPSRRARKAHGARDPRRGSRP